MRHVKKLILVWLLLGSALCGCGRQTSLLTTADEAVQTASLGQSDTSADGTDSSAVPETGDSTDSSAAQETDTTEGEDSSGIETVQADAGNPETSARVYVYVCGAVNQSGVYELPAAARKEAAVQMAGGFREDADDTYVNLAELVTDGERIYIPTKDETADMPLTESEIATADGGDSQASSNSDKVNINTADRDELMTLPGIGESKADAIIEYRETQGKFTSPDELMNISGIKEGVYNKIKDRIIVG